MTFYSHKNRVEKEIENEKISEEAKEKKRKEEFGERFPFWNKIPVLRSFIKWMYKEGWAYSLGLIAIVILGFVLRIWNLESLMPFSDEYTHLYASKLFFQESIIYEDSRGFFVNIILGVLFKIFSINFANLGKDISHTLFVARLPEVIMGVMCLFAIYFLMKKINKKIALISSFLLCILPIHISLSKFIREYIYFFLIYIITIYILIEFLRMFERNKFPLKKTLIYIGIIFIELIYILIIDKDSSFKTLLFTLLIFCILIIPYIFRILKKLKKKDNNSLLIINFIWYIFLCYKVFFKIF